MHKSLWLWIWFGNTYWIWFLIWRKTLRRKMAETINFSGILSHSLRIRRTWFQHIGAWKQKKMPFSAVYFSLFPDLWLYLCLCVCCRHQRSWKMILTLNRRTMILAAGLVSRLKMTSLLLDRVPGWVDVHIPSVLQLLKCTSTSKLT